MGFLRQEYWSGLLFPSPVDHILSELSTMICLSLVALHSMAHSFIELDKAVVHVIRLINFLWWWFSVCLPLMEDKRRMKVSWQDRLTEGESVIIHLEPDILECEVRWALESITTNKASGGDGIPVELFQILKENAVKCCTQNVSKFGKLKTGHRTGEGQFSFQYQRKAMPKNAQTTAQLHSSHTLVK